MRKSLLSFISIIVAILGLFIAYQILTIILGGSWNAEDVILTLLMFSLATMFSMILFLYAINSSISGLISDHNHLSNQFRSLANDFKEHLRKYK